MKVVIYIRTDICSVQTASGGSVGHTLGVLLGLQKLGYSVVVFSSQMHAVLEKVKDIQFVPLVTTKFFRLLVWQFNYLRWRLESFFSTFFFFFTIAYATDKQNFSFVYQRYSILNFTGVLLAWYYKIPLVLEYNGSEAYWFGLSVENAWYQRWFVLKKLSYWVENLNVRYATIVIAVSKALYDDLVARGFDRRKILINPNGVDPNFFDSAKYRTKNSVMEKRESMSKTIREKYKLGNRFVFGFIGTFGHWHGIEVLEYIIPKLCAQYNNACFFLIGDGALKARAQEVLQEQIAAGQCIFVGRIDQDKAPEYLAACDAFLCPTQPNADGTRFFGSPTKLFEYMSMAKPVIASDLEQVGEIVSPAVHIQNHGMSDIKITDQVGFVFDPFDWAACLAACVTCLHISKEDRQKMGNNARKKILVQYTWQKHVEKIIEHFQKL